MPAVDRGDGGARAAVLHLAVAAAAEPPGGARDGAVRPGWGAAVSAITAEEMAALWVPLASLPGFDPVGLRVLVRAETAVLTDIASGGVGPAEGPVWRGCWVWWADSSGHEDSVDLVDWSEVILDLADASTRDRVARWLAGRVGFAVGCTAPDWIPTLKFGLGSGGIGYRDDGGYWTLCCSSRTEHFRAPKGSTGLKAFDEVPGLVSVDPHDAHRLPDDSRYADALALARVAVHTGESR